jgi:hypothetical protein
VLTEDVPSGGSVQQQQQQQAREEEEDEDEEEEGQQSGGSVLPLAHFSSNLASDGRLLRALAGQTQLTALQLPLISSGTLIGACPAALASLISLQSLTLNAQLDTREVASSSEMPSEELDIEQIAVALKPALQRLTRLTHLFLSWLPDSSVCATFPPSLVSLQTGGSKSWEDELQSGPGRLQLQHLTCLTHLDVHRLDGKCALPPSVQSLHVHGPLSMIEPDDSIGMDRMFSMLGLQDLCVDLSSLQHLQHLDLYDQPNSMAHLQRLKHLTHLGLRCDRVDLIADTSAAVLPTLPLKWLHLDGGGLQDDVPLREDCDHILAHLGGCTQLTCLKLQELTISNPVANLSRQLPRLHALQELQLVELKAAQPRAAAAAAAAGDDPGGMANSQGVVHAGSAWGPIFTTIPSLVPLKKLVVEKLSLLDSDVDALGGVSQLSVP